MGVSSKNLAKALMSSLMSGTDPETLAEKFEDYLKTNHLTGLREKVLENLSVELREYENKSSLIVTTSHEIKKDTLKNIEKFVQKSEKDKTSVSVDESLIGGFKATYKGVLYDGSVKNYLKQVREVLAK